jgi:ABC-type dipeptide/oligopeptide/nickel transport system permease component
MLGTSIKNPGVSVSELVASRFSVSLQLGIAALSVTLLAGIPSRGLRLRHTTVAGPIASPC